MSASFGWRWASLATASPQHQVFCASLFHSLWHAVPRYAAAWCRGWLYLQAGNNIQALRDAQTALAYSATAAVIESVKPTLLATQPGCEAPLQSLSKTCVPPLPVCSWFPALLLAGECFMALESWPQAVLHFAKVSKSCSQERTALSS